MVWRAGLISRLGGLTLVLPTAVAGDAVAAFSGAASEAWDQAGVSALVGEDGNAEA